MKKKCIMALIIGAAFLAQGCGYEEGTDAVVTVVDSTPTPEPTEKPKATATPTPKAAADSTADGAAAAADSTADGAAAATDPAAQTAATEQTPSGINVQAQDATYYAVEGVNLRSDANAEAEFVAGVLSGESLKCTGVCDNGWIRVDYNGQTCSYRRLRQHNPAGRSSGRRYYRRRYYRRRYYHRSSTVEHRLQALTRSGKS